VNRRADADHRSLQIDPHRILIAPARKQIFNQRLAYLAGKQGFGIGLVIQLPFQQLQG
jgi:hypothetical protein